eukprot:571916_1
MSLGAVQIAYIISVSTNVLILIPISCYHVRKLWLLRDDAVLSKRYPKLVILIFIVAMIHMTLFRTIADLTTIAPSLHLDSKTPHIAIFLYNTRHICFSLLLYRIWLLYYDYTRGLHLISKQWQSHLIDLNDTDYWTLKYTFLSHRSRTLYWICFLWLIFVDFCMFFSTLIGIHRVTGTLFMCIVLVVAVYLTFKVRTCRDTCFFYDEIKWVSIVTGIALLAWVVVLCIGQSNLKALLVYIIYMVVVFINTLIATQWVILQHQKRQNIETQLAEQVIHGVALQDVLRNADIFDYFALHLVKEWSIENLIFLYECMQFKTDCVENELLDDEQDIDIGLVLEFGRQTKRMECVVNDTRTFCERFEYIFNKYVDDNAEYCVNVSSKTRKKLKSTQVVCNALQTQMQNISVQSESEETKSIVTRCIGELDEAMKEIMRLLSSDSFTRFVQTASFKQMYISAGK